MIQVSVARTTAAVVVALVISGIALPGVSQAPKNIVDTAVDAGNFKTFTQALTEAGLTEALKDTGPFTVFAPTDEAFAKLPPGTVDSWMKDKAALAKVLNYHVVRSSVMMKDLTMFSEAKTVQGSNVRVTTGHPAGMFVETSKIVKADIPASNGVIHAIDGVLKP